MFFSSLVALIVQTVFKFLIYLLLLRFWMVAFRLPFHHPMGELVRTCTSWLTRPFEGRSTNHIWFMVIPFVLAWILSFVMLRILFTVFGNPVVSARLIDIPILIILGMSLCEVIVSLLWLLTLAIILEAILSWVNPYAPIMPFIRAMTAPLLNPVRRRLPTVGNIDFSPLVVLLILQVVIQLLRIWYPFHSSVIGV